MLDGSSLVFFVKVHDTLYLPTNSCQQRRARVVNVARILFQMARTQILHKGEYSLTKAFTVHPTTLVPFPPPYRSITSDPRGNSRLERQCLFRIEAGQALISARA